ncbi:DUF6318 family protein [Quadrisphaera sp. DSM 44207]|uniref:DUF6318 family protein n=1 Tax=Quadrisphaera sp. DSM 44207 TaxID=1881057 RepID=UPI000890A2F3|nr:DUF6318 family protein [Quadrisphaera sp. DSM 44207]SDQ46483.1 hypothetical protein SAMN05428996_1808 [Quadrisphaera sp. DSM 44207]
MPKVAARIAVVGVLALSACSGGDEPDPAPAPPSPSAGAPAETATPTPTETATATVVPPVMPPEARERTTAGAEAFTRFYFDAVNHGFRTGDTSLMEAHSMEECTSCSSTRDYIREPVDRGGTWEGTALVIREMAVAPLEEAGAIVDVYLEQPAGVVHDADGSITEEPAQPPWVASVYLRWREGEWATYGLVNADE